MNAFSCDSTCIIKLECNDTREGYVFNVYDRPNNTLLIRLSTFEAALSYARDRDVLSSNIQAHLEMA